MKVKLSRLHSASLLSALFCASVQAQSNLERIPDESGFSGFVQAGATFNRVKSNMVAGSFFGDVAQKEIDSLFDQADAKSSAAPLLNLNLEYTFAGSRTQVFLGTQLIDVLRFDFTPGIGVRQEIGDQGILSAQYLVPNLPTKVWEDPYVTGQDRKKTDRKAQGLRLGWRDIMATPIEVRYTYRKIDLDDEASGAWLGLDASQRDLLDREGEAHRGEVFYRWELAPGHRLTPTFLYTRQDLDGRAMRYDEYGLQLTYSYQTRVWSLIANGFYSYREHDETNPIYAEKQEDDSYGLNVQLFYHRLFGLEGWSGVLGLGGYVEDANIDFYDAEILQGSLSALYRF